jgi:hypothetical protein
VTSFFTALALILEALALAWSSLSWMFFFLAAAILEAACFLARATFLAEAFLSAIFLEAIAFLAAIFLA